MSSERSALTNGLAGAAGGIIAQIITYPLQTVNTRQQTERTAKKQPPAPSSSGNDSDRYSSAVRRSSTLVQMIQLVQAEGWGGLYSGLKPSLLGTAASQGVYYYFYQLLKNRAVAAAVARKKRGRGDGTVGIFSWLLVAAIAGSLNVLLTNPIWVLVTRMQTHTQAERKIMEAKREALLKELQAATPADAFEVKVRLAQLNHEKPRPYGTLQAVSLSGRVAPTGQYIVGVPSSRKRKKKVHELYSEAGIRGFWKGLAPTLIMVCNPSIQFMIYETSIKHLQLRRSRNNVALKNLTALEVFLLGALAKLGATVTTYPLLVVKSRLQAKQEIGRNAMSRYTGTLDAIVKIIQYEGLRGFYKGMGTKIVQSVFAASVLFMVKEELVKTFSFIIANTHIPLTSKKK